ncbi:MAG: Do family serine endopeptidase [Gammaproteobacteria bacterium]|nr:Do family serine endopeptidase [Gammaproteobacteria bacterium]
MNQSTLRISGFFSLLAALLLLVSVAPSARAGFPDAVDGQPLPSLAPMLERVTPAVVNISTRAAQRQINPLIEEFFGIQPSQRSPSAPQSLGSGVIVDAEQGLIVTNYHVIEKAAEIQVTLADGRELIAELIGTDPPADVALIQVEADDLIALKWADSSELRVGDFCVAIGNPFGLGQTVTSGIVSALERSGLGIEELENFIQTDASINPGNSGGALVNLRGELIGINTAIVGPSGGNVGIGFAIPANMAQDIVDQLLEFGEVRRGMLGISAQALTPALAQSFGLKQSRGVVIVRIEEDSPAERAGLEIGDVLIEVNGKPVKSVEGIVNRLGLVRLGEEIDLKLIRENRELDLKATVAIINEIHPLLEGVTLEDAVTSRGRRFIVIESVRRGSKFEQLGLRRGDAILTVNRVEVERLSQMKQLIQPEDKKILLLVQRGRETRYIDIR